MTVIVPVYNKEDLLRQCMDSFAYEEFGGALEVIVIDDGSTDSSYSIILEYAKRFPQIFFPVCKENGGVSSVMNLGLKMAKGKYVKEVDADDWVDTNALKRLLNQLSETDVDIVLNPFQEVDVEGKRLKENFFKGIYFYRSYLVEDVVNKVLFSIQSITVKKEIFDNNSFYLDESRYYVDMQFVESAVLFAETCLMTSDSLYRYRKEQEIQSVSISSYIDNYKCFYNQTLLSFDRLQYIRQNTKNENKKIYFYNLVKGYSLYMYAIFLLLPEKPVELEYFDDALIEISKDIYRDLVLYRCVKYIRKWIGIPWPVKRWLYLRHWDIYVRAKGGKKELGDVRFF